MTEQSIQALQEAQRNAGIDRSRTQAMATFFCMNCEHVDADGTKCTAETARIPASQAIEMAESWGHTTDEEIMQWIADGLREDATARGWQHIGGKDICPDCQRGTPKTTRMLRRGTNQ